jgi:hypothetical protein
MSVRVFLLACLAIGALAQLNHAPVLFVTPNIQTLVGLTTQVFHLPLCASVASVYDGFTLDLQIVTPYTMWDVEDGFSIELTVYQDAAMTQSVCTNGPSMGYNNCTFTYQAAYTDLWITAVVGNVPVMSFTMNAQFLEEVDESMALKYDSTLDNTYELPAAGSWVPMTQMFVANDNTIMTSISNPDQWSIMSCPPSNGNSYYVLAAVQAQDDESAFASYMCFTRRTPCTAGGSPPPDSSDRSGSAMNFLGGPTVRIPVTSNVTIAVYGAGHFQSQNTYQLAVVVPPQF